MSDLFHKVVLKEYIADVFHVMRTAQWHTFQVLTKRSSRMRTLVNGSLQDAADAPNIWWGVSVEDRKHGLRRIQHLQEMTKAKVKWLSIEPLLEDLGKINLKGIQGVVIGGESGPGARPMEEAWVQSILEQCQDQHVPFFFKQWGGVHKKKTGRMLNGRTYDEQPESPQSPVPPRKDRLQMIEDIAPRIRYWKERKDVGELVFRDKNDTQTLGTSKLRST